MRPHSRPPEAGVKSAVERMANSDGRESVDELSQRPCDGCLQFEHHRDQWLRVVPVLKGYCEERTQVLLHLGWRLGKGPRLDVTFGFHAAPVRQLVEADLGRKLVLQGGAMRARYEMELPMLVDVVQGVQVLESLPDEKPILPSVVWLKKTDRLPLRLIERLNVGEPVCGGTSQHNQRSGIG